MMGNAYMKKPMMDIPLKMELESTSATRIYLISSISDSRNAIRFSKEKVMNTPPIMLPANGSVNITVGITNSIIPINPQTNISIIKVNLSNLENSVILASF